MVVTKIPPVNLSVLVFKITETLPVIFSLDPEAVIPLSSLTFCLGKIVLKITLAFWPIINSAFDLPGLTNLTK